VQLTDFRPSSMLVTPQAIIEKPRYPVVDAHNHLGNGFGNWLTRPVSELLETLDQSEVRVYIDLDGGWGEAILQSHLDHFKNAAPERFIHAAGVNWSAWTEHGDRFGESAAKRIRQQAAWGAQALKVWKNLGLHVMDHAGKRVWPDDARLEPIWATAGELQLPVVVHVADPVAFFEPLDPTNERWEELQRHPDWHFLSPPFPPFLEIVNSMAAVVKRFPDTTFIGAHVGWYAENLSWVGDLLDECPNFYVDIGARIGELGRQPYSARRFFQRYADRILFGTDAGPRPEFYRIYYRFLESEDEYFNYNPGKIPGQGRWQIYGLSLAEDILEKVYFKNAVRVFRL
jgi:predicted TIM-barrel fold metal-dependent hydrolase